MKGFNNDSLASAAMNAGMPSSLLSYFGPLAAAAAAAVASSSPSPSPNSNQLPPPGMLGLPPGLLPPGSASAASNPNAMAALSALMDPLLSKSGATSHAQLLAAAAAASQQQQHQQQANFMMPSIKTEDIKTEDQH
jgi:hypothetical protein